MRSLRSVITVLLLHMACQIHIHEMLELRNRNLPVCPMKYVWYWSHLSTVATDGRYKKKTFAGPSRNYFEKKEK